LLPPSTLISILPFLPDQTSPPIRPRDLPSGLKVLYSPTYSSSTILSRLIDLVEPDTQASDPDASAMNGDIGTPAVGEKSLSLVEIAGHEGLAVGLVRELMDELEGLRLEGHTAQSPANVGRAAALGVVRDDQAEQAAGGVRWYRDLITGWEL
jgi:ESCRT-II complex subunit VPS36